MAPHPDDETLPIGGTVATWAAAGTSIEVVAVTDGEASHPGAPGLAERRAEEQRVALAALGVTAPPIRLRLPDTGVAAHHQLLVTTLSERLVGRGPVTVILAPWELDAHGDHDAVGRAALAAAAQTGATCVRFPVWAWQWATPETFAGLDLRRLPLSPDATRRKTTAVACFPSQTEVAPGSVPILSPGFLERFRRPSEVLIEPLNA
ncbi:MAG: PIG-L deacetylase family protein [Acidimicrobiales bacterium]